MTDPRDKAIATAPPVAGEGCLSRYDPDALSDELGTDFPGAVELWESTRPAESPVDEG